MFLYHLAIAICLFMLSIPFQVNAEGNPAAPEYEELGEISVTATKTKESVENLPADVEVITAEEIKRENIQNLDEALRHVTGAYAKRNRGMMDTLAGVTLRGFPGDQRTLVLVDGQPLNDAYSGSAKWTGLPTENIERIEVVKGPFSSLYGGNAMGGVINIITKTPYKRSIVVKGGAGTWDTISSGVNYSDWLFDRLSLSLDFNKRETNGYVTDFWVQNASSTTTGSGTPVTGEQATRDKYDSPAYILGDKGKNWLDTQNFSAKLSFDLTPEHTISLGVMEAAYDYGYSGGQSYLKDASGNRIDSGKVEIGGKPYRIYPYYFQGGSGGVLTDIYTLKYEGEAANWLNLKASVGLTDQGKSWYATPKSGSSGYTAEGGTLNESPKQTWQSELQGDIALGDKNLLTLGLGYKTDKAETGTWKLNNWQNKEEKGDKTYECTGKDTVYSVFLQDKHEFPGDVTLYAGFRYDYWKTYNGSMWDQSKGISQQYDSRDKGYLSPKLALHYKVNENLALRTSAGSAFRWPNVYELYGAWYWYSYEYLGNADLKPETTKSWDLGADITLNDGWTVFKTTYFENYVQDLIYRRTSPTNSNIKYWGNAGKAEIRGIELGLEQKLASWLDVFANFTYTDSRIVENSANPTSVGKQITQFPRETASIGLNSHWDKLKMSLTGDYQSKVYTEENNSDTARDVPGGWDRHFIVNAKLSCAVTEYAEVSVSVDNVFDNEYYMYYKAPGRSVFGELTLRF